MSIKDQIEGIERLLARKPYMAPHEKAVLRAALETLRGLSGSVPVSELRVPRNAI